MVHASHERHGSWKGENISNSALHSYLRRHINIPESCGICNVNKPFDLANITGIYNRDHKNWMYMCRSCHSKFDGKRPTEYAIMAAVQKSVSVRKGIPRSEECKSKISKAMLQRKKKIVQTLIDSI
jgi:hypothetical protein